MDIIKTNPYRIAGLLSNASARELQKQKTKIKAYIKVGKAIHFDNDLAVFGDFERSEAILEKAFAGIEQNQDKVEHALFWFLNANPFDETAIAYLVNGDEEKAMEIWEKVTYGKEVTPKNFSSFNNIGTLKLVNGSRYHIQEGIEAKIQLIESPCFEDFVHLVADETFTIDSKRQTEKLIDQLLEQFQIQFSNAETLALFKKAGEGAQQYLSQKLTEKPIYKIERQIEKTKQKRKEDGEEAYEYGRQLFNTCKAELESLKSLLGNHDLKYKMLADKLAKEVMQCGIDYFNEWQEVQDPSEEGLELLRYARSVATGTQTKDRIKENIEGMEEWAQTSLIREDMDYVATQLRAFQAQPMRTENATALVRNCRGSLQKIKSTLGPVSELYLGITSAVAGNALGMVVGVVNEAQSGLEYNQAKLILLPSAVSKALTAMQTIGTLDMDRQTRQRFNQNKSIISDINSQLESVRRQIRTATTTSSSSGGGCYIATMAYGDYDHPQVMELRKFRDEFLSKTRMGRRFIRFYYKHSPSLVKKLKHKQTINRIIRKGLDQFIKAIKK